MTVKSRYVILEIPHTPEHTIIFALVGINSISFSLNSAVGTAQGIAANFIHQWFFQPVTVTLSGKSYIGAFHNIKDLIITETGLVESEKTSLLTKLKLKSSKRKPHFITTPSVSEKPQKSSPVYPRIEQLPRFLTILYQISEDVRLKRTILDKRPLKQKLIISDYMFKETPKPLVFEGVVSDIKCTESAFKLGTIEYTVTFTGVLVS